MHAHTCGYSCGGMCEGYIHLLFCCVQTLMNSECYHEFCRLLMRVKSNYQLGELLRLEDYNTFINLVAKFTVSSLQVSTLTPLSLSFRRQEPEIKFHRSCKLIVCGGVWPVAVTACILLKLPIISLASS